jgi:hypothetical protein
MRQQQQQQLAPRMSGAYSSSGHQQQLAKGAYGDCGLDPGVNSATQPNLQFEDADVEGRFVASQAQQWARMDGAFVAITLLLLGATVYGSTTKGLQQQLLLSLGQWLLPAVAGCWMLLQPHSYCKHREAVWAVHRVVAAAHTAGVLALCGLQQQWQFAGAAAGVAATGLWSVQRDVAGMLRRRALAMLVESLGFKVCCRRYQTAAYVVCF